jgi:hypothetical protein
MIPTRMRRLRLARAEKADLEWLRDLLTHEGQRFNTSVQATPSDELVLSWA